MVLRPLQRPRLAAAALALVVLTGAVSGALLSRSDDTTPPAPTPSPSPSLDQYGGIPTGETPISAFEDVLTETTEVFPARIEAVPGLYTIVFGRPLEQALVPGKDFSEDPAGLSVSEEKVRELARRLNSPAGAPLSAPERELVLTAIDERAKPLQELRDAYLKLNPDLRGQDDLNSGFLARALKDLAEMRATVANPQVSAPDAARVLDQLALLSAPLLAQNAAVTSQRELDSRTAYLLEQAQVRLFGHMELLRQQKAAPPAQLDALDAKLARAIELSATARAQAGDLIGFLDLVRPLNGGGVISSQVGAHALELHKTVSSAVSLTQELSAELDKIAFTDPLTGDKRAGA